ncbi:unnamed protein product [Angiostrongylus costaricensis]|uniref:Reverse transcriptase domain-containing protein n=1 Tax=Angiostrongylus costaricensis TaxID=334426 RepID=A0A0R3PVK2_ANGCS|nr:unnamed protein product [Angiostrongylus costaricensis]
MHHIHTITGLVEVLGEYERLFDLTFSDLMKAFDSFEIEAVTEALDYQDAPTQFANIFHELFKDFTSKISPFHNDINIVIKRAVRTPSRQNCLPPPIRSFL